LIIPIENEFHYHTLRETHNSRRAMSNRHQHQHTTLVVGETCRVDQCSSGAIHLTLGNLTIRISPADLLATATALKHAAARLENSMTGGEASTRLLC
jgi:hypothetical protein